MGTGVQTTSNCDQKIVNVAYINARKINTHKIITKAMNLHMR